MWAPPVHFENQRTSSRQGNPGIPSAHPSKSREGCGTHIEKSQTETQIKAKVRHPSTVSCQSRYSATNGVTPDRWTLSADGYTPAGCGYDTTDHWQSCAPSVPKTFGTLTGFIHTNSIKINGYENPPNRLPGNTR